MSIDHPPGQAAPTGGPEYSIEDLLRFERVLSDISARFVGAPGDLVESQVLDGLKSIAAGLDVERCTLTDHDPVTHETFTRFSFAGEGRARIPPMRADILFPWTTAQLSANKVVVHHYPDSFPPEAEIDRANAALGGFKSSVHIPIVVDGSVRFILSAAALTEHRTWPEELVSRLRLFGEILGNALIRKQRDDEIRRLKELAERENVSLREVVRLQSEQEEIVGKSDALQYVLYRLEQVAPTDATVLLLGETGVGKELFAKAIHRSSARKEKPLLKVDCAALAPTLIESELFGHERGAFTGASTTRKGRFELADGGTIFLDEIGDLPPPLQAKLLRVLQDGSVERVGAAKCIKVNVRVIAATNRDLGSDMQTGRFRQDLFFRLNTFPLTIPPLRDRTTDIPLLVDHFIARFNVQYSRSVHIVPPATLNRLTAYRWPGNIRELENVIERAVITARGGTLEIPTLVSAAGPDQGGETLKSLADVEREHILSVLAHTMWRIEGPGGAAVLLGLHPDTLRYRMKKLGIHRPQRGPT